jgi:hypothetical protein
MRAQWTEESWQVMLVGVSHLPTILLLLLFRIALLGLTVGRGQGGFLACRVWKLSDPSTSTTRVSIYNESCSCIHLCSAVSVVPASCPNVNQSQQNQQQQNQQQQNLLNDSLTGQQLRLVLDSGQCAPTARWKTRRGHCGTAQWLPALHLHRGFAVKDFRPDWPYSLT